MSRSAITAATLLLMLLLRGSAGAQPGENLLYYINAGVAKLSSPDVISDYHKPGYVIGTGLALPLDGRGRFLGQATVDYSSYNLDQEAFLADSVIPGEDATVSGGTAKIIYGAVNGRLGFSASPEVTPYLVGGVGMVRVSIHDAVVDVPDSGTVQVTSSPETKLAVGIGAGVEIKVSHNTGFTVEGQYRIGFTSGQKLQYLPVKVGLVFKQ